jgi:nucleotide-binding universal stress UspA family protein
MSEPVLLVPLDGSEAALAALPVAEALAQIDRLTIYILHVGAHETGEAEVHRRLAHRIPALEGLTIDHRGGVPAEEILHVAHEIKPRLIIMCKHSGSGRELLGRTAMKVVHDAPYPLVLVPPERGSAPWRLQHILVPHDGTPTTSAALQPAATLADRARAELLVVHVTGLEAAPAEPGSLTVPRYVDQPQHDWPAWSSEFLNRLGCICSLGHLRLRLVLAQGNPAMEILRLSQNHFTDLIILAWRGRWEAPRATTLKTILRNAQCPVLVIRA